MRYDELARQTWRDCAGPGRAAPRAAESGKLAHELIRCATLAPSSHNTQCWRFESVSGGILIRPDLSRRCPAVDPDDHHLYVSLGCAAENLRLAARAHGLGGETTPENTAPARSGAATGAVGGSAAAKAPADARKPPVAGSPGGAGDAGRDLTTARIALSKGPPEQSPLYDAIARRQCSRAEYDGSALCDDDLLCLQRAARADGMQVILLTARSELEHMLELVAEGNRRQLADPAFIAELKHWVRFNEAEAVRKRDGLFASATGNPKLPRWLGAPLLGLLLRPGPENDKYARQIRSAAGIAVFFSERDDPAQWLEAGRCYQRFALQATALGVRNAFVNQPVEDASLRRQLAEHLGLGRVRVHLLARFGRGPEMPRSLRRPTMEVIDD